MTTSASLIVKPWRGSVKYQLASRKLPTTVARAGRAPPTSGHAHAEAEVEQQHRRQVHLRAQVGQGQGQERQADGSRGPSPRPGGWGRPG